MRANVRTSSASNAITTLRALLLFRARSHQSATTMNHTNTLVLYALKPQISTHTSETTSKLSQVHKKASRLSLTHKRKLVLHTKHGVLSTFRVRDTAKPRNKTFTRSVIRSHCTEQLWRSRRRSVTGYRNNEHLGIVKGILRCRPWVWNMS